MAIDEVGQPLQGCQGLVSGPQVPLLGHGNEINDPKLGKWGQFIRQGKYMHLPHSKVALSGVH